MKHHGTKRSARRMRFAGVIGAAGLAATALPVSAAPLVQAYRATEYTDAIGVNIHVCWNLQKLHQDVQELDYTGILHVRDTIHGATCGGTAETSAFDTIGVGWEIIFPEPIDADKNFLQARLMRIDAVEGPNEPNLQKLSYQNKSGTAAAVIIQKEIYDTIKTDEKLNQISVVNFSIGYHKDFAATPNPLHDFDVRNLHIYSNGGNPPGQKIVDYTKDIGGTPLVISETGYTTITYTAFNLHPGLEGVDETTAAKYLLDSVADGFLAGAERIYLYDLDDDRADPGNTDGQFHFGLFHFDGSPKPAATAFHNLRAILNDQGRQANTFKPGNLAYQIGDTRHGSIHTLLLQKSNGLFMLIVWTEPKLWDRTQHRLVPAPPGLTASIDFARPVRWQLFDPLLGTAPSGPPSSGAVAVLSLPDHPIIVQIDTAPSQ